MANPFQNCPPLPSPTQVQTIALASSAGNGVGGGSVNFNVGGAVLGPINALTFMYDLQNALSMAFAGSVVMGTPGGTGIPGLVTIQFFQDPGVPITATNNSLTDGGTSPLVITPVISPNPGTLYPNYTYLTTRWPEFIVPGATPAQMTTIEQNLIALKQDAWRYVQPQNWGGFAEPAIKGGGAFVRATFLMIAHLKKLGKDPVGFITEQQAKNLRESYSDDKWMAGTVYGQEFMRLRNATIISMRFIPAGGGPRGWPASPNNGFEGPSDTFYQPIN